MNQRALADKLMDLALLRSRNIAVKWYSSLAVSPRTTSFIRTDKRVWILHAQEFFENLKRFYFSEDPFKELQKFLNDSSYIRDILSAEIPVNETVYAIIMMRRHLWLYAEMQAIFNTALDMYQAVESINRTILIFDYAVYIIIQKYKEKK